MKISILTENMISANIYHGGLAEWGFSAYVEKDDVKILFDFGASDVYLNNAKILGIDLTDTDFVVVSHHHHDHMGGMLFHPFKERKKLIAHPDIPKKLSNVDAKKLNSEFDLITTAETLEFAPDCFYLGQIPRSNDFESGIYEDDDMNDDSAIAFKTDKGAVVIAGCSHAGICNICEYAKKITGQELFAVMGGFHLFPENRSAFDETVKYFENEKVEKVMPMHCVDFSLLCKMHRKLGCRKYFAGDVVEI